METTAKLLHDYGWAGVVLVILADRVFPFFMAKVFPQFQNQQQAKIAAEKEERDHRHRMELRQAEAFDELVKATQGIKEFMVSINDRLGGVEYALRDQAQASRNTSLVQKKMKPKRKSG